MAPQLHRAFLVVGRFDRRKIGLQRSFDVDDDVALLGHVHDHVGPNHAGFRHVMMLLGEVDMSRHAR